MTVNRLSFPAKVKDTGCGVRKITLPEQTLKWVLASSPDIEFLDSAKLTRSDGTSFTLKGPKLSRGTKGRRYFALPKKIIDDKAIEFDDEFQVTIAWMV